MKATIYTILLLFVSIGLTTCYRVKPLNIIFTGKANNISSSYARIDGVIIDIQGTAVRHGHCYSTSPNPDLEDKRTQLGSLSEARNYSSVLGGLLPNTTYFVRGYMEIDNRGVVFGEEISFNTGEPGDEPQLSMTAAELITTTEVTLAGLVKDEGVVPLVAYGFCWDTNPSPTVNLTTKTTGSVPIPTGEFSQRITGLLPNTRYYARFYVTTNSNVSFYSDEWLFTTATP